MLASSGQRCLELNNATWEIAISGTGIEWDMMLPSRYTSCLGGTLLSRLFLFWTNVDVEDGNGYATVYL